MYDSVAGLLGCSRDEVAIVENATRAWDMAFYSVDFQPGDRILTCGAEYASNYIALLQVAKRTGAIVVVVADDESGQISLSALEAELARGARLVSLVHVPSQGGLVQPAAGVGALCRSAGVPLLLDACQSAGQLPTDVGELQCDMLSATGRKFLRGPRGTGFLYVRQELIEQLEPPFLDLHAAEWTGRETYAIRADARRFENWETSYATKLGLGAAVDYALDWGIDCHRGAECRASPLRSGRSFEALPGVDVRDRGVEKCGIVTFTVEGTTAQEMVAQLSADGNQRLADAGDVQPARSRWPRDSRQSSDPPFTTTTRTRSSSGSSTSWRRRRSADDARRCPDPEPLARRE